MNNSKLFSSTLLDWHAQVDRFLPWKEDNNVFYIWLSEIILQQTKVEQGIPYFLKFKARFKNIFELASASDEEIMKLWEGLGYYSRARNMHEAAKQIVQNGGQFPNTYETLLQLKGVGPYTAAAIASFAYKIPIPVIDGNVNRVISRIFGIHEPIDSSSGKKEIFQRLLEVFDSKKPSEFNQAIMDFGALQCTPKLPDCKICPFNMDCSAFLTDTISLLPIKTKRIIKKNRTFNYIIIIFENKILIRKRKEKDIWKHLHEFILIEGQSVSIQSIKNSISKLCLDSKITFKKMSAPITHLLTHQKLEVFFFHFTVNHFTLEKDTDYFFVDEQNINNFAFPKIIENYLKENLIYLKAN